MRWVEWPPATGFDVLGSLFNSGPAWVLFGLGVVAALFIVGAVWSIFQIGRNRGREFQRELNAEIERRERRRGEGSSVGRHCTLPTSDWGSTATTPTGWRAANTHDQ